MTALRPALAALGIVFGVVTGVVLGSWPVAHANATPTCEALFTEARAFPARALKPLQDEQSAGHDVLGVQRRFERFIDPCGGGACATVTAFNLLQAVRAMLGHATRLNPSQVIQDAFAAMPVLTQGRVTNEQMVALLHHLAAYLPGARYRVHVSDSRPDRTVAEALEPRPLEMKILTYKVYDARRGLLGRHFVVLKELKADGSVVVVDPGNPRRDYAYELAAAPDPGGAGSSIHLLRTDGRSDSRSAFVLDTVFSFQVE